MLQLILVCEAATAADAIEKAFSQVEATSKSSFIVDPIRLEANEIHFYRWLSLKPEGLSYPDVILEEDGVKTDIIRYADGGYVSPEGEGTWAIFMLSANAHMLEEAAVTLCEFVDPDWGRYEN